MRRHMTGCIVGKGTTHCRGKGRRRRPVRGSHGHPIERMATLARQNRTARGTHILDLGTEALLVGRDEAQRQEKPGKITDPG